MKRFFIFILALIAVFSLTACGHGAVSPAGTTEAEQASVEATQTVQPSEETVPAKSEPKIVNNVDDFLAAIEPDAEIILEEGDYYLHSARDYGSSASPYYAWVGSEGEYTLTIQGADNLTIRGAGSGKPTFSLIPVPPMYCS